MLLIITFPYYFLVLLLSHHFLCTAHLLTNNIVTSFNHPNCILEHAIFLIFPPDHLQLLSSLLYLLAGKQSSKPFSCLQTLLPICVFLFPHFPLFTLLTNFITNMIISARFFDYFQLKNLFPFFLPNSIFITSMLVLTVICITSNTVT